MCEFDEKNIVPGWGYMEIPQHRAWLSVFKDLINREDGSEEWVQRNVYDAGNAIQPRTHGGIKDTPTKAE